MKKCIALILACAMLGSNAYAQITTNYIENENFTTTQEHYSISGSSDPDYPLYINGEEIERTESGYFSYYASLAEGENKFVLENTSDSKTITINRTVSQTSSGSDSSSDSDSNTGSDTDSDTDSDGFIAMDAVGLVGRNHPTVRSRPDEASDDLIGPYVKDTLLHIVGKNDDSQYYKTANGAYLYYDSVDLVEDATYDDNSVKSVTSSDDAVTIEMDRATEYKCELTSTGLRLTLFDTEATDETINVSDGIVESIARESASPAVYDIKFAEENRVVGYMCYYDEGTLKIAFNERHILTDNSLNGIKIYLDAGHGGDESGAAGLGALPEKVITLSITEYLGDYLKNKGAEIVYTREDDSTVSLSTRMARIIEEKPDISVSIHCNSMNAWTDFNLYTGTLNLHTYDSPTQLVEKLTEYIEGSTYRKQNLALTRTSICPAVLIETGFISNPGEYEYLSKDENQKEMAEKIGDAIEKYFYNLDGITDSSDNSTTSSGKGHSSTSYATKKPTATTEPTVEPVAEPTATPDANIESTPEANVTDGSKVVLNDIENHWAKDYITSAFEKGLVSGYGNGVFKPDNSITRAEFIQILYNVFGNGENGDISFSDVSENEWYYECVKWGVASGLISGYTDNTFGPNKEISREEAAAILSRCESIPDGENNIEFKDASDISEWAKDSVNEISKTGIMQGDDNGYFNPKKSLTRAEMTVIANKLLSK